MLSFCDHRNRFEEGLSILHEALESPAFHADTKLAASLLSQTAHFKYRLDRYAEAEADAAAYADQVKRLRDRLAHFEETAAQIPEAEAELAELNRDYDVIKLKHADLLARREQAKISRDREEGTRRVDYEIVDPARIPVLPDGPSRAILISVVLAVGVGAGIGAAFLLSQARPTFSNPLRLRETFGLEGAPLVLIFNRRRALED